MNPENWFVAFALGFQSSPLLQGLVVALCTFVLEDPTTVGSGLLDNGAVATVGIRNTSGQVNGERLQWSFNSSVIGDGTAIEFTTAATVPEPGTIALFGLGISGLCIGVLRRRRRRRRVAR